MSKKIFFLWCLLCPFICMGEEFVSLKQNITNLRTGPGNKYPVLYIYQEKHFPLKVLDTYDIWIQVQEIDGTKGWVNKVMTSKARYAYITKETNIYNKPTLEAEVIGIVQPSILGAILKCPSNMAFCLLDFQKVKGWVLKENMWGLNPGEII